MHLFTEPKLKRIARHLRAQLGYTTWNIQTHSLALEDAQDPNTSYWYRRKEEFNWAALWLDVSCFFSKTNSQKMERLDVLADFFESQLEIAQSICTELENKSPNYANIIIMAKAIKDKSCSLPSLSGQGDEEFKLPYLAGGNLLLDLVSVVLGLIYIPAVALRGLFLIPAYINGESQYCGSPEFFLDAAKFFCGVLLDLISSLIFPIAMLQSKYETDSFNVVKGRLIRKIDSIISLAEEAIVEQKSKADIEMDVFVSSSC